MKWISGAALYGGIAYFLSLSAHAQEASFCEPPADPGITCIGDVRDDGPGADFGELIWVGRDANGSLEIGDGGAITIGPGPVDEANPNLTVGSVGNTGVMTITGSGEFRMEGDNTGAFVQIGDAPGSVGTINVTNGGSFVMSDTNVVFDDLINRDVYIDVGNFGGDGALYMDDGAILIESNATSGISVSSAGNSIGSMQVLNGSSVVLTTSGDPDNKGFADFNVGRNDGGNNTGFLEVIDSTVILDAPNGSAFFDVGEINSTGTAIFSGSSTNVTVHGGGEFSFFGVGTGANADGELTVTNGATLSVEGAGSIFSMGRQRFGDPNPNTAVARTTISDGGQIIVSGTDFGFVGIGDTNAETTSDSLSELEISGPGSLLQANTGVAIGTNSAVGSTTAIVTLNDGGTIRAPQVDLFSGGILQGNGGIIEGTLNLDGGLLDPGLSPGIITVDDLVFSGGVVNIEIGGTTPGLFDQINILGSLTVEEETSIFVSLVNDFFPEVGQTWDILNFEESIIGDFANLVSIDLFGFGADSQFDFAFENGSVSLVATAVSAVPLPAGFPLVLSGLALLAFLRRNRPATVA